MQVEGYLGSQLTYTKTNLVFEINAKNFTTEVSFNNVEKKMKWFQYHYLFLKVDCNKILYHVKCLVSGTADINQI